MPLPTWQVSGSYIEACNCDAICPCRRGGGRKPTSGSTHGFCEFARSWLISDGRGGFAADFVHPADAA